ncbi:hypothetical protein [uncultured Brachyspira sp.]|uniref:hypothetical protein n=1 Tax=uncultured Brachyspira sp. TaxID=221953 RepID=UPI002606FC4E|nr:hypothetical protein [uncultured Brachyspira sp.]
MGGSIASLAGVVPFLNNLYFWGHFQSSKYYYSYNQITALYRNYKLKLKIEYSCKAKINKINIDYNIKEVNNENISIQ